MTLDHYRPHVSPNGKRAIWIVCVLVLLGLAALWLAGCAKAAPATPTPAAAPPWPRVLVDYTALEGPFPPEPTQPLPEDPRPWPYTALTYDEGSQRLVLDPLSIAVPVGPEYWAYPVVMSELLSAGREQHGNEVLCLPPPPLPAQGPAPPAVEQWAAEKCAATGEIRAWLTGQPAELYLGGVPIEGRFGAAEYIGAEGPAWIHVDTDPQASMNYAAFQFQPFSKRLWMSIEAFEYDGYARGIRIHPDVPNAAALCVEETLGSGQHRERCTTFDRLREFLLRHGRPMAPAEATPF